MSPLRECMAAAAVPAGSKAAMSACPWSRPVRRSHAELGGAGNYCGRVRVAVALSASLCAARARVCRRCRLHADFSAVARGELCVVPGWVEEDLVSSLRADIDSLRAVGAFQRSGLSNIHPGDPNEFNSTDRLTCSVTEKLEGDREARRLLDCELEKLRLDLQGTLGKERLILAEQYYSVSPPGTFLKRHMDERHEETKGQGAYESESRRSISWLLYLSPDGWDTPGALGSGGSLRGYCRSGTGAACGAHEGNLQVGWLAEEASHFDEPVFLDSWVKSRSEPPEECKWRAQYALYCVRQGKREYLTNPFGPDSPSWPYSEAGMEPADFAKALAQQLPGDLCERFAGVEEVPHIRQRQQDVSPEPGKLVLFDSVAVPHKVLVTTSGERLAIAGWFHEPQQTFPDWYGS
eukprot:TRINITY_DN93896_c0_g1_i1.p1 TRINITY_DN93896_c0_g1~~TRINITY_DN93896_c0_g1_i1.p1  ORF type:complete len:407 (-),score=64.22 TRINITY_DN93896_c0_g1_i1:4-1224(-)